MNSVFKKKVAHDMQRNNGIGEWSSFFVQIWFWDRNGSPVIGRKSATLIADQPNDLHIYWSTRSLKTALCNSLALFSLVLKAKSTLRLARS